jgi:hypothetical protein
MLAIALPERTVLRIGDGRLVIDSFMYSTRLSMQDIDVNAIEYLDLEESGRQLGSRTNGIGLPSMLIGWFRAPDEKQKLYITDRKRVLRIPTKKGYAIYFSTPDGREIREALKGQAAATGREPSREPDSTR